MIHSEYPSLSIDTIPVSPSSERFSQEERIMQLERENALLQELLEEAQFKASHDALTGLPNATGLEHYLESQNIENKVILFVDGDNFGQVNKKFSHDVGDRVIADMATILRTSMRETDFISRQGGDEFVIIMEDARAEAPEASTATQIERVKQRINQNVTTYLEEHAELRERVQFGVSIGAAIGYSGATFEALRHDADMEMKKEKAERKRGSIDTSVYAQIAQRAAQSTIVLGYN